MQRKPLPRPPKNNTQVNEYTGAVKRGLNDYYITSSGKGWSVRKASASTSSGSFNTKTAAITFAKKSAGPRADIVIHDKDGRVTLLEVKTISRSPQG